MVFNKISLLMFCNGVKHTTAALVARFFFQGQRSPTKMFPLKAQAASPPSMMQAGPFRVHLWRYAMPWMPAFYDFLVSLVSLVPDPATTCLCCGELYANRNRVLLLQRQGARPHSSMFCESLMDSVGSGDDAKNLRPSELSFQQFTEILEWWPQRAWTMEIHLKASRLEHPCVWHQAYLGWVERPSNCWKLFDLASLPRTVNRLFVMLSKYECLGDNSCCSVCVDQSNCQGGTTRLPLSFTGLAAKNLQEC